MNNSDKNTNFELNQYNSVNERYKLNSTEKYRSKSVKISTIIFIFAMFIVAIGLIFKEGEKSLPPGSSYSYLEGTDYTKGDIKVKGVQLKIYQDSGEGYQDVTSTGFDLNTKTFATDVRYNYDLIIKNDENATVTADQYYLRWNFIALVDNQEYDITDYCKVDTAFVYKQKDTDGKTRFYSVSGTSANTISAQNQLAFLSSIRFDGVYDNLTHKYGSILDNEFSGSKIKIIANIEGSLTPYDIITPTVKFYNADGNIMQEISVDGTTVINIPNISPTSSITVEGETLYFQGWIKNGVAGVIYTPNEKVEVSESDVFTPYYAVDADYSTTFAYTQDPVTGELIISGANSSVTEITIPALIQGEPVTIVNNRAFYSYTKLQTVTMPQTITKIGEWAFYNCTNLTSINIPESVTTIGNHAFRSCNKLESIKLPNTLTSIGSVAFYFCRTLTDVIIPESVTSIGDSAFGYCTKLTSITIPKNVFGIGSYVFEGCSSLISIDVDSENANYCSEDGVLFNKSKSTLIKYPEGKLDISYIVPASVKGISAYAFFCCKNLTLIDVDSNNTAYCSIDGVLYNKAKTYLIQYPADKTGASYTVPDGVTSIYHGAFSYCENLTTINLPDGLEYLKSHAFYGCLNLTLITIPNSVTSFGSYAFYNCSSLTSISIPTSVTIIEEFAFYNCSSLPSIIIPNSVKRLSGSVFRSCTSLTSITIPDSVIKLGSLVFYGCSALTSVEFENTTGWYATTSSSFTGGTSVDVTKTSTNATNFKNSSGSWYSKYLYRE